jgi:hypothetical protein
MRVSQALCTAPLLKVFTPVALICVIVALLIGLLLHKVIVVFIRIVMLVNVRLLIVLVKFEFLLHYGVLLFLNGVVFLGHWGATGILVFILWNEGVIRLLI